MPSAVSEPPDSGMAYRRQIEEIVSALGTDPRRGRADAEARSRLAQYGRN